MNHKREDYNNDYTHGGGTSTETTKEAGQLAIHVKQTPEKLAETKPKTERTERVVRGLIPGSAVSGLGHINNYSAKCK
jgi:hypothetical protein